MPYRGGQEAPLPAHEPPIKTFAALEEEVVQPGLCAQCGGCISFCSAGQLNALGLDDQGLPHLVAPKRCLACGICHLVCPLTHDLDAELRQTFAPQGPAGGVRQAASARATNAAVRRVATDGGVVTALLLYLLDRGLVDGALVSRRTEMGGRIPTIATDREGVIAAAGSHFLGTTHLEQLGEQYSTYAPTVPAIKGLEANSLRRVAMVGTPCQINAVRKMQCLSIVPADVITYTIGLFCLENFRFTAEGLQSLIGVHLDEIAKINIKDEFLVTLTDGRTLELPLERLEPLARPACLACTEFANEYADIAVGGLGSPAGYTTTLVRSDKGWRLWAEALRAGYVEEMPQRDASHTMAAKARLVAGVAAFARRKRERGLAVRRARGAPK